jgi:hypothetical protein
MPFTPALSRIAAVLLLAALALGVATPAAAQAPNHVYPYVNCVDILPELHLRVHFGYVSTFRSAVTFSIGPDNFMSPGVINRGQPTEFQPGFHDRAVTTAFQLSGRFPALSWVVQQNASGPATWNTSLLCGVRSRGEWDTNATYAEGDLVRYNGALFVNVVAGPDICPDAPAANSNCWFFYAPTPPVISEIADQTTTVNGAINDIPFTLSDAGNIWNLTVLSTSSDTALLPLTGIVVQGSGANRTVSVTPAPNRAGMAVVTLYVSDGVSVAVESFTVNVTGKEN